MRAGIKARHWVFSLDPDSPALRESLHLGGRAVTVLDGDVAVLRPHGDPDHLAPIMDVPVTLSGLSEDNIANALAATAAARGEHEAEAAIAELRADPDERARIAAAQSLVDTDPSDPRLTFELASAYDSSGDNLRAIALYDKAVGTGREPHRHQAMIQQASGYRSIWDLAAARRIPDGLSEMRPSSAAVAAFRALTMLDQGEVPAAVADLINVLLCHSGDADDDAYRASRHRNAADLR